MIEYKDHPDTPFEEYRSFEILDKCGDYFLIISDGKKELIFRFCISGGFEFSHPEITKAIANLHRAMKKES